MVTVQLTGPQGSESGNKNKRKRTGSSKSQSASSSSSTSSSSPFSIMSQLQTLENWHRALTIDMREMRREGFRVRLELEKITDTVEDTVERAERCALEAKTAQEHALAVKDETLQETQRRLERVKTRDDTKLETVDKKLVTMERKLDEYKQSSINEEFLMTQLMELQEHYENELTMLRKDYDAALSVQQKRMEKMETMINQMQEERKEWKSMEKMVYTWRDEKKQLKHQMMQLATQQEVYTLQKNVETMEKETHEEQGRTRVDLNTFEDRLEEMERRIEEMDNKELEGQRNVIESSSSLPEVLGQPGELAVIHDELQRINRDFQAVEIDISSLTKRADAERSQQYQRMDTKLRELSTQLFDALNHDSHLHASEITRLKGTVYDVQREQAEFHKRVRQLEGNVHQASTVQAPIRSPRDCGIGDGWSYQHNQPQTPQTPMSNAAAYHNRRKRPSRYEPASEFHENLALRREPPHHDRFIQAPQRASHHRSRSPVRPRRYPWDSSEDNAVSREVEWTGVAQNDHRYHQDGHRDQNYDVIDRPSTSSSQLVVSSQGTGEHVGNDSVQDNQEEVSTRLFRRIRQPRRNPEVIIIEEDDDATDGDVPASMISSPRDVVLDEEGVSQAVSHLADAVIVAPSDTRNSDAVETIDLLQKESDLQMGFLLYFSLGGAPNLDAQWTACFTHLKSDECVEMPRALRFQRQYPFLQSFPVYLTQCILQAVILNGQSAADETTAEISEVCGTLSTNDIRAKFDDVVKGIHLLWATLLIEHIKERTTEIQGVALEMLKLSVNPAGLASAADNDNIIYEWSRRQESILWRLAQKLHYGSLLSGMNCNADVSPSVYLFTLMFDVLAVSSGCPQLGTFRLNDFGSKLMEHLWISTLKKLPYVFFADWSWLDNQLSKQEIPPLAFCHILTSILLWNSATDRHSLTNRKVYAAAIDHVLSKLYVRGQPIHGSTVNSNALQLAEWASSPIELLNLDNNFASVLRLDGFFEVMETIQNNRLQPASDQALST